MGTRGIWGFRLNEQDKLTYNHFDSYPEALGVDLVKALSGVLKTASLEYLKAEVACLRLVEGRSKPTAEDQIALKQFANLDVSEKALDDWYCLLRETQGDFEKTLTAGVMIDSHDFVKDSLFCEFGYIINLDTESLECYRGFVEQKPKGQDNGRYCKNARKNKGGYYPIRLVGVIPFGELSEDRLTKLYERIQDKEDAEDEL